MNPIDKARAVALYVAIDALTPRQHFADEQRHAAGDVDPLAGVVKQPEFHRATVGRRRSFLSANDARAYEDGYRSYPHDPGFEPNTPFSQGFWDADKRATVAL